MSKQPIAFPNLHLNSSIYPSLLMYKHQSRIAKYEMVRKTSLHSPKRDPLSIPKAIVLAFCVSTATALAPSLFFLSTCERRWTQPVGVT